MVKRGEFDMKRKKRKQRKQISCLVILAIIFFVGFTSSINTFAAESWRWPAYDIYAMYRGYSAANKHYGIDISTPLKTPIHATKSGTVI